MKLLLLLFLLLTAPLYSQEGGIWDDPWSLDMLTAQSRSHRLEIQLLLERVEMLERHVDSLKDITSVGILKVVSMDSLYPSECIYCNSKDIRLWGVTYNLRYVRFDCGSCKNSYIVYRPWIGQVTLSEGEPVRGWRVR